MKRRVIDDRHGVEPEAQLPAPFGYDGRNPTPGVPRVVDEVEDGVIPSVRARDDRSRGSEVDAESHPAILSLRARMRKFFAVMRRPGGRRTHRLYRAALVT